MNSHSMKDASPTNTPSSLDKPLSFAPVQEADKAVRRLNIVEKKIKEKREQVASFIEKIQELQYERYEEIRRRNPELKCFDDCEITLYINLFDQNRKASFKPHNVYLYSMGALILVMNWFMFNAGSSHSVDASKGNNVLATLASTVIAASAGLITAIFVRIFETKLIEDEPLNKYDMVKTVNGLLSACVGVTGSSNNVELGSAFIIGVTSALIYMVFSRLVVRISLDDPLEVTIIHGVVGFWGVLCVGIFDRTKGLVTTGQSEQLYIQLYGGLALLTLAVVPYTLFFFGMKQLYKLRVGEIFEILGQDVLDKHDLDIKSQIQNHDRNRLNDID